MADKRLDIIIGARNEAENALNNVKNMIGGIGAAYLSWEGAKKTWAWTIGNAAESEMVFGRLRGQVEALGISYGQVESDIKGFTGAMLQNTRFSDEDAARALQLAITHVNNLADAEKMVAAASNIAARFGEGLADVTQRLSLGYEGATRGLKQYGIIVDSTSSSQERLVSILEQANNKFSGAALEDLNAYAGRLENIKNKFSEMGETVGKFWIFIPKFWMDLLGGSGGNSVEELTKKRVSELQTLISEAERAEQWYRDNDPTAQLTDEWNARLKALRNELEMLNKSMETSNPWDAVSNSIKKANTQITIFAGVSKKSLDDSADLWQGVYYEAERLEPVINKNIYATRQLKEDLNLTDDQWKDLGVTGEKSANQVSDAYSETANIIYNAQQSLANGLTSIMMGERTSLAQIFKGMAYDFIKYFVEQCLIAMGAFKAINSIFGGASSAMGMGSIFGAGAGAGGGAAGAGSFIGPTQQAGLGAGLAGFFSSAAFPLALASLFFYRSRQQGHFDPFANQGEGFYQNGEWVQRYYGYSPGSVPDYSGPPGPESMPRGRNGRVMTFNFYNPIGEDAYWRDVAIPQIERIVRRGESRLAVT